MHRKGPFFHNNIMMPSYAFKLPSYIYNWYSGLERIPEPLGSWMAYSIWMKGKQ